jgi:hypothetical protein
MNGGLLVQNVRGHATFGTHQINNMCDFETHEITSTHHQMQYPFNLDSHDYDLLWVANPRRSEYYEGDQITDVPYEPEIVLYHVQGKPKCLAIQGHPEMMRPEAPVLEMLNRLINNIA